MEDKRPELGFTGERVVPDEKGFDSLFQEHVIRYLFAKQFVQNKIVLDAGCGTGYGSYYLAKNGARKVFGIDVSKEAVDYAKSRYAAENLEFNVGDCTTLDFPDRTFDVVVAFEIVEHVQKDAQFIREAKRVLKPDGLLIMSTPNKDTYEMAGKNKFHFREYNLAEFKNLLTKEFKIVKVLNQIYPSVMSIQECLPSGDSIPEIKIQSEGDAAEALYFIALCGSIGVEYEEYAYFFKNKTVDQEIVQHLKEWVNLLQKENAENDATLQHFKSALEEGSQLNKARISDLETTLQERDNWISLLKKESAEKDSAIWHFQKLNEENKAGVRIADLEKTLGERDNMVRVLMDNGARKNERITDLEKTVSEREAWIRLLQKENSEKDRIIRHYKGDAEKLTLESQKRRQDSERKFAFTKPLVYFARILLLPLYAPLSAFVLASLLATDILASLLPKQKYHINANKKTPHYGNRVNLVSVVIPTYNGEKLLEECLPPLKKALSKSGITHEIIAVDDCSSDGTIDFLKKNHPEVKIISLSKNQGFSSACNAGLKASRGEIVCFLNNDMIVDENFITPLLDQFDDRTFAVTSQIFFQDKDKFREETGKTRGNFNYGMFEFRHEMEGIEKMSPALYAGGGSSAFDREKLLSLGGFPEIMRPFYGEDSDLSYRAWMRGWKVFYEPESQVWHKHRATIGRYYSKDFIESTTQKNSMLFTWANLGDKKLLLTHFLILLLRIIIGGIPLNSFWRAFLNLSASMRNRFHNNMQRILSDEEILQASSNLFLMKEILGEGKTQVDKKLNILYLCPYMPYPPAHGGAVRMFNSIKKFSTRHNVHVISFIEDEREAKNKNELLKYCKRVELIPRRGSVHKILSSIPLSMQDFASEDFWRTYLNILSEEDIDVIETNYTQMAQYWLKTSSTLTSLIEHDVSFISRFRFMKNENKILKKIVKLYDLLDVFNFEVDYARKFDLVVTVAEREKKILESFTKKQNIFANPTTVDPAYFTPKEGLREDNILFLGYFNHSPNIDGFFYFYDEIWPIIKKNKENVKLYVVGKNPPAEISKLNSKDMIVTGYVEDTREYYNKSKVFVVPILSGAGIRIKILEAMAMKIPIVSTSIGCEGLDVTDGVDILIANEPEGFAEKVISLLGDKKKSEDIANNAHNLFKDKYGLDKLSRELEDTYEKMLEVKRRK